MNEYSLAKVQIIITTNNSKVYLRVIRTVVLTRVVAVTLVRTLIVLVAIVSSI